ncbi:MAG: glycosyltransferase 87 family protein, partial [Candidatus Didemnitutus sp.]|nr:glycosyltransferase 87 family protein [Candidatus Didemnitutus sp.]
MTKAEWLRWRWTYACGATVALALFALVAHGGLWELLGVQHMHPYFADLAAILAAGQAHVAGFNVYEINPFDPFGRPHVYGPLWLLTGQIGWVAADAWWLGLLLVSVFLVVALGLLEPRSFRAAFVVTMVLLSPPVLLGIERANNDLIIFLLFVIGAAAAARQGRAGGYAGAALIVISAGLKFYPLVALPSLFARNGRLRSIAMTVGGGGAIFAVFWWLQRDAIAQALSISPRPSTVFAFGVPLFPIVWEQLVEHRTWLLFGFFVGGVS